MAIRAKLPVVPVAILGTGYVLSKGSIQLNKRKIKVIIAEPIETVNLTVEDKDFLINKSRDRIACIKTREIHQKVHQGELHTA